jgi:hypothetical protein
MNELTIVLTDEQLERVKEMAARYRASPVEIVQCFVNSDVRSSEDSADTDEFILDELHRHEAESTRA